MKANSKRTIAVGLGALLAGGLAGGVLAAHRALDDPGRLESAMRNDPMVRVADIEAGEGLPARGVFVQETSTGLLCLFDAPSRNQWNRQGGCNPADDPLGGKQLSASFAYDGGPAVADVKDARLSGLVSPEVAAVEVLMSDGTRRPMRLKRAEIGSADYGAFGYRFKKAELRRGVTPTTVIAVDEDREEIDRQATGFVGD